MKVAVIVCIWLLLSGGIGDAAMAGDHVQGPGRLLLFYFAASALTALAVWAEFGEDAPTAGTLRPRRARWHHD